MTVTPKNLAFSLNFQQSRTPSRTMGSLNDRGAHWTTASREVTKSDQSRVRPLLRPPWFMLHYSHKLRTACTVKARGRCGQLASPSAGLKRPLSACHSSQISCLWKGWWRNWGRPRHTWSWRKWSLKSPEGSAKPSHTRISWPWCWARGQPSSNCEYPWEEQNAVQLMQRFQTELVGRAILASLPTAAQPPLCLCKTL